MAEGDSHEVDQTARMTIDEVARAAGTTARNVRAYQERGLLAPPTKVGRTGYYDEDHLARLQLIARLLDRGFTLASIGELLTAWDQGDTLAEVLGLQQALTAPYATEEATPVDPIWLARTFPAADVEEVRTKNLRAGTIVEADDGTVLAPSKRLLELAAVLRREGVPTEELTEEAVRLHDELDGVAARFHSLFETYVWRPFMERGAPVAELGRIAAALDRFRPIPAEVAAIMVAQAMERRMQAQADAMLDEATHPPPG